MAMSKKAYATTVGGKVGLDPTLILTILSFLTPLIQQWCKPKSKSDAKSMIDDEYRRMYLVKLGRKKGDKCPSRLRKAFRQAEVYDKGEQDRVWTAMVETGFEEAPSVAGFVA